MRYDGRLPNTPCVRTRYTARTVPISSMHDDVVSVVMRSRAYAKQHGRRHPVQPGGQSWAKLPSDKGPAARKQGAVHKAPCSSIKHRQRPRSGSIFSASSC